MRIDKVADSWLADRVRVAHTPGEATATCRSRRCRPSRSGCSPAGIRI